jgi:hypothetical protein
MHGRATSTDRQRQLKRERNARYYQRQVNRAPGSKRKDKLSVIQVELLESEISKLVIDIDFEAKLLAKLGYRGLVSLIATDIIKKALKKN